MAQSGTQFCFQQVGAIPQEEKEKEDEDKNLEEMEIDLDGKEGDSDPKELTTPKHCRSVEDKMVFLLSLLPPYFCGYHVILENLALEEVSTSLLRSYEHAL